MNIYDAADKLQNRLDKSPWLNSVGAGETDNGEEAIFIYTSGTPSKPSELDDLAKNGWMGFRVVIERVGRSRPLSA